jgi:hypothetical protein
MGQVAEAPRRIAGCWPSGQGIAPRSCLGQNFRRSARHPRSHLLRDELGPDVLCVVGTFFWRGSARPAQQVRQLGDVGRDASRFVPRQQSRSSSTIGFFLVVALTDIPTCLRENL